MRFIFKCCKTLNVAALDCWEESMEALSSVFFFVGPGLVGHLGMGQEN